MDHHLSGHGHEGEMPNPISSTYEVEGELPSCYCKPSSKMRLLSLATCPLVEYTHGSWMRFRTDTVDAEVGTRRWRRGGSGPSLRRCRRRSMILGFAEQVRRKVQRQEEGDCATVLSGDWHQAYGSQGLDAQQNAQLGLDAMGSSMFSLLGNLTRGQNRPFLPHTQSSEVMDSSLRMLSQEPK